MSIAGRAYQGRQKLALVIEKEGKRHCLHHEDRSGMFDALPDKAFPLARIPHATVGEFLGRFTTHSVSGSPEAANGARPRLRGPGLLSSCTRHDVCDGVCGG